MIVCLGGIPHVCGGNDTHTAHDACWRYVPAKDSWMLTDRKLLSMRSAAGWTYNEAFGGLVMVAGADNSNRWKKELQSFLSTEYGYTPTGSVTDSGQSPLNSVEVTDGKGAREEKERDSSN
jgi:hypothetical protein